jgi:very-short-patch-repair endonuclease
MVDMPHRLRAALPTLGLDQARSLRQNATDVENELWYHLRARRMQGVKFRRQHPIPPYTVDFYCDAAKLVVELDGAQHSAERDRSRTDYLERLGLRVMRFDNLDVIRHRDAVLDAIWKAVAPFAPHPNPSPDGRGA